MDDIVKSARTSNALGYIYLRQEEYDKAIERFEDAITRDATFESPLMNLAELAVKDGDRTKAIDLYRKALTLADDRGLIYLRLGELLLSQSKNNITEVKTLWKNGIDKTVDEEARQQLMDRLAKL
jgi:Tfp pilus assembly protein PilF